MMLPFPVVHLSVSKDKSKMLMKPEEAVNLFLISCMPSLTFNENDGAP